MQSERNLPTKVQRYFDSLSEDQRNHWSRSMKELIAELPEEAQKEVKALLGVHELLFCPASPFPNSFTN
jgi:hypothetical protein